MSTDHYGDWRVVDSGQVALDSTGDKYSYVPVKPVRIVRAGVIASTVVTFGSGLTIKGDKQPTAGSATGRGDGDVFELSAPDAASIAQGKGVYKALGTPGTPGAGAVAAVGGVTGVVIRPGEAVIFEVTAAMTAGDGHVFLHVQELPWQSATSVAAQDWLANMTEDTS